MILARDGRRAGMLETDVQAGGQHRKKQGSGKVSEEVVDKKDQIALSQQGMKTNAEQIWT